MPDVSLHLPLAALLTAQVARWVVWSGLVAVTLALVVLMRTHWGQSHPLRKCIVLSLIAHLLFGIYTTTVEIVGGSGSGSGSGPPLRVAILDGRTGDAIADSAGDSSDGRIDPWNHIHGDAPTDAVDGPTPSPEAVDTDQEEGGPAPRVEPLPIRPIAPKGAERMDTASNERPTDHADIAPPPKQSDSDSDAALDRIPANAFSGGRDADRGDAVAGSAERREGATSLDGVGAGGKGAGTGNGHRAPRIYDGRSQGARGKVAQEGGGNANTEAAVNAALAFLAAHQSPNGSWNPRQLEAGREVVIDGQNRSGAGTTADTGITGLALLSFLAAGNTHLEGDHKKVVQSALEYLLDSQAPNGNLWGAAQNFERMYCHAMATCALSEAFAMTGDKRLEAPVRKAISYSLSAQDALTGGWRYEPGSPGDTSQLGWQVMALKSAEQAGLPIPSRTRDGVTRYLRTVAVGPKGGLACYRPGHQVTRAMTAEALVCREFMGLGRDPATSSEASRFIMEQTPGVGQPNVYYWYYATLGLHQLQSTEWQRWNAALQSALLPTQRTDGAMAGSWDPDPVWGAYGGRAYSTALSALCLEVYYRYLPLHVEAAARDNRAK